MQRYWVERGFQICKDSLGMTEYQVRGWRAWYHHITLTIMALHYMLEEKVLNENEIPDIAKWVSQTSSPPAPSTIIGDSELGQNLYQVCSACHGVNGEGNEALNAPPLAGIDDWYLVAQIKNFRDGLRGANPKDQYGAQMKAFVASIKSDDDINNLVSYINQLTKPKR